MAGPSDANVYRIHDDSVPLVEPTQSLSPRTKRVIAAATAFCILAAAVVGVAVTVSHQRGAQSASNTAGTSMQSRPTFANIFESLAGLPTPTVLNETDTTITVSLSFVNNTISPYGKHMHTHLNYHVTMVKKSISASKLAEILAVNCSDFNKLTITFDTEEHAAAFIQTWDNNTLFFIRNEWHSCLEHVRRFVSDPIQVSPAVVSVRTINATLLDAFEHASIQFRSNHSRQSGPVTTSAPVVNGDAANTPARRGLFGDIESGFDDVADASDNLASDVSNAVISTAQAAKDITTAVFTGDLSGSDEDTIASFVYPTQTETVSMTATTAGGADTLSLTATAEYGGSFEMGTIVDILVQDRVLLNCYFGVTGDLSLFLATDLVGEFHASKMASKNLLHKTLFQGWIPIGGIIEFPVNLKLNITAHLGFNAHANINLGASVNVTSSANVGISYKPDTGLVGVGQPYFNPQMSLNKEYSVDVEAEITASLEATFSLQACYLATAYTTFAAIGTVTAVGTVSDTTEACLNLSEQLDAQVSIGGIIQLDVDGYKSPAYNTPVEYLINSTLWEDGQHFCEATPSAGSATGNTQGSSTQNPQGLSTLPVSSEAATTAEPASTTPSNEDPATTAQSGSKLSTTTQTTLGSGLTTVTTKTSVTPTA